ncbi:MAG: small multi-drug export protein [candidate division WOR-3 bacterium]|nr:small multi-drug export protein [candidate division WOR-3 bacterium]
MLSPQYFLVSAYVKERNDDSESKLKNLATIIFNLIILIIFRKIKTMNQKLVIKTISQHLMTKAMKQYSKRQSPNSKILLLLSLIFLFSGCGARSTIITTLQGYGISPDLAVLITAMLPIVELRGAIPLGINFYNLDWYRVVILAIIGNILPILPMLFFLNKFSELLSRIPLFKKFFDWLFARTRKKSKIIEEYEMIGLMIFVAIPLPATGAWTGTVAAFLLGLGYFQSLIAIFCGVLIAAIIVTTLSLLGLWGAIIAGLILIVIAVRSIIAGYQQSQKQNKRSCQ